MSHGEKVVALSLYGVVIAAFVVVIAWLVALGAWDSRHDMSDPRPWWVP